MPREEDNSKGLSQRQQNKQEKKAKRQQIRMQKKEEKKLKTKLDKLKQRLITLYYRIKESAFKLYHRTDERIKSSIRLEILFIVGVSLLVSGIAGIGVENVAISVGIGEYEYIKYDDSRQELQSKLASAIQSITNIEQMAIEFNIDSEDIKRIISTMGKIEGAEQLKYTLDSAYTVRDINNEYSDYNNYDMHSQEVSIEEYKLLYEELNGFLSKDEWSDKSIREVIERFLKDVAGLTEGNVKKAEIADIVNMIDEDRHATDESQTYIIDSQGNTVYNNNFIKTIDVVQAIQKSQQSNNNNDNSVTSIYPIIIDEEIHYLFNESVLSGEIEYHTTSTATVLGVVAGSILFITLMFYFTKSKLRYIEYISHCLGEISKGDLSYQVEVVGKDELAKVASDIAYMEEQIKSQIDAQMQSEKTKNELITNVAHDLRTPLTSIIGYVGLIKDKRFESEEEYEKYLDIAYSKAEKLKVLIEDLFEYTKLNNQVVKLKKEPMSVTNLMNQLIEELMPIAEEKQITIVTDIKATNTTIKADIPKMTRVFENLVENAIKYSEIGENVYIGVEEVAGEIFISIRNKCKEIPQEDIDRLFDRFYRSDSSRNSNTGGSGLGLAIAKNIINLHDGQIWAQMSGDVISFNVKIKK